MTSRTRSITSTRAFLVVWLLASIQMGLLVFGCASSAIPVQLKDTIREACDLYQRAKPEILEWRQTAKDNWSDIPEDWKPILLKLDSYLPELDRAGQVICAASVAAANDVVFRSGSKVNWDDVLATVIKAASIAANLKSGGVISHEVPAPARPRQPAITSRGAG